VDLRRVSRLVSVGSFVLFGGVFALVFFGKVGPAAVFPLFIGIMVVSVISRMVLGALSAKPALEKIRAALTGAVDPALGGTWRHGVGVEEPQAVGVFACTREPGRTPLVGDSEGLPARVSYQKLTAPSGGTYLLTFAAVEARQGAHTVVAMRGPQRPWQVFAPHVVDTPHTLQVLGAGWRIAASDPSAIDAVITPDVAAALARSHTSVAGAVWVDGEVAVSEDGNRTSPTRLAELFRLAKRLAGALPRPGV
jgi:hypothetical protein